MYQELNTKEWVNYGDELTPENINQRVPARLPHNAPMADWIAAQFEPGYQGWAIDVGASDGRFINSTWKLERERRWNVLSIEANPLMKPLLQSERTFVEMCAVGSASADGVDFHMHLDSLEAFSSLNPVTVSVKHQAGPRWKIVKVNVRTLEQIIAKWQFPRLDALCVDVEGGERDVLKGLDIEKWQPRVVVVECWTEGALDDILTERYERRWRQGDNDCYVRIPDVY